MFNVLVENMLAPLKKIIKYLKNTYTAYKTRRNQIRKQKNNNKKTLKTLKAKYHTHRAMNLPSAITLSKSLNIDYQTLKAVMQNPKLLRATTKNKKAYETLRNTYRKNMETAKTIYGKRSTTRKMMNRFKKTLATLVGRE